MYSLFVLTYIMAILEPYEHNEIQDYLALFAKHLIGLFAVLYVLITLYFREMMISPIH